MPGTFSRRGGPCGRPVDTAPINDPFVFGFCSGFGTAGSQNKKASDPSNSQKLLSFLILRRRDILHDSFNRARKDSAKIIDGGRVHGFVFRN